LGTLAYAAEPELFVPVSADTASAQTQQMVPFAADSSQNITVEQSQKINRIKQRHTTKSVSLIKMDVNALKENNFHISLSPGKKFRVSRKHFQSKDTNNFIWSGEISGSSSMSTFVVQDGNVTGSIRDENNELYRIEPVGNGVHALTQIDESRFPPSARPLRDPMDKTQPTLYSEPTAPVPNVSKDANTVEIDVLVAFTPSARTAYGDMASLIRLAVAETNQTYQNSGINIQLNLVDSFEVNYSESGKSYETILSDFMKIQTVKDRRNSSGADMNLLIINQRDYCGMAYLYPNESYAFGLIHYDCAVGIYTFAHELGHIQGAGHNEQEDRNPYFTYGHGYIHPSSIASQNFRTVMAYECPGSRCTRIPYWSNPNMLYNSVALGTASTNNNVRLLNETAPRVAAFRARPASSPVCTLTPQVSTLPSAGGSYTVSASCTGSPTTYTWSVNGQVQSSRTSSLSYNFPANNASTTQSFVVAVTASNNTGSGSAQVTLSQAAVAPSSPVCTLTPQVSTLPSAGGNYMISANCTGSPSIYTWSVNGQAQSSRTSSLSYSFPANNTSTARSFIVAVTASNNAGSGSAQVTLSQAATSVSNIVCTLTPQVSSIPSSGGSYMVSASCTGSPTSYLWSVNGQLQSSRLNSLNYNFPANHSSSVQSFVITLTAVTSTNTGTAQVTLTQAAASVSSPVCTLTAQVSNIPSAGGNYTVSANCTGSPSTYTWSVNGQAQSSRSSSLSYNFPANNSSTAQSFRIIVTATNNAGIGSAQLTLEQAGMIASRPVCTLSSQVSSIPSAGGNYTVNANCTGSPITYTWSVNGQAQSSRTSSLSYNFPANNSSTARSFVIVVTATNNVGSSSVQATLSQAAASANRPVCALPNVATLPNTGGNYIIYASCSGSPTTYTWSINGQMQSSRSGSLTFSLPRNNTSSVQSYVIVVTASNSAGSGSAQTTLTQAGAVLTANKPVCSLPSNVATLPNTGGNYIIYASCTGSPTTYTWSINGQVQSSKINSLTFSLPRNNTSTIRSYVIAVTASNRDGSGSAQTILTQAR